MGRQIEDIFLFGGCSVFPDAVARSQALIATASLLLIANLVRFGLERFGLGGGLFLCDLGVDLAIFLCRLGGIVQFFRMGVDFGLASLLLLGIAGGQGESGKGNEGNDFHNRCIAAYLR